MSHVKAQIMQYVPRRSEYSSGISGGQRGRVVSPPRTVLPAFLQTALSTRKVKAMDLLPLLLITTLIREKVTAVDSWAFSMKLVAHSLCTIW